MEIECPNCNKKNYVILAGGCNYGRCCMAYLCKECGYRWKQ